MKPVLAKTPETELPVDTNAKPSTATETSTSQIIQTTLTTTESTTVLPDEKLFVFPKFLNTSEQTSVQLECKYTGHQYLTVDIVWYKNDHVLRYRREGNRIISLDYTQSYTRISIIKFKKLLRRDSGLYKCVAYDVNKVAVKDEHLKLFVNSSKKENNL